jgi:hypothetical protein
MNMVELNGWKNFHRRICAFALVSFMVGTSFLGIVGVVHANVGGSSGFGYEWTDSNSPSPSVAFNWKEINSTGDNSGINGGDVYGGPFNIGFSFPYFGNTETQMWLNSKGCILFDGPTADWTNDDIPNSKTPNNFIAAYWDDLRVSNPGPGQIYYETDGPPSDKYLVVEWCQVQSYFGGPLMTFEIILDHDGNITFQYLSLNGWNGTSASVGLDGPSGIDGCKYSYNEPVLSDNLAIRFHMSEMGFGPSQSKAGTVGTTVSYNITVRNYQAFADSFDLAGSSEQGWPISFFDSTGTVSLMDTNGDLSGLPDTGNIASGGDLNITVKVSIPASPVDNPDIENITATSYANSSLSRTAALITWFHQAWLDPPHNDFGVDSNADGQYDFLVVEVSMEVLQAGYYEIEAMLSDASYNYIDSTYNWSYLDNGSRTMEIMFDGWRIYSHGVDGPYNVNITLYYTFYTNSTGFSDSDRGTYVTAAYSWEQFQAVSSFKPPHDDYGRDTNGDGLYDQLVVEISLNVTEAGYYEIYATLYDSSSNYIQSKYNWTYLNEGFQTVELIFKGTYINANGVDGPYNVSLVLYRDFYPYGIIDTDTYVTGFYSISQFQVASSFKPPHSDFGRDTDGDGKYDYLIVLVSLNITEDGYYGVYGTLRDDVSNYIDSGSNWSYFVEGTYTMEIEFVGILINDNGADCQFNVSLQLYDNNYHTIDTATYTTSYYSADQFEIKSTFKHPHSDYGSDTNADGLYELLIVEVTVNITSDGYYEVYADLYNNTFDYIDYDYNESFLTAGIRTVELEFGGARIYRNGVDGQFNISLRLYDYTYGVLVDTDYYTTGYYASDEFQKPSSFEPPYNDYALDTDSDGLYDYLVVEVTVNITSAGYYDIRGILRDSTYRYIDTEYISTYLGEGIQTLNLSFAAYYITEYGVDGQFNVSLRLYDQTNGIYVYDAYTTDYYSLDQFDRRSSFEGPHSDYGLDTDGNGLFDYLVVDVRLNITEAGIYTVYGSLMSSATSTAYLYPGINIVELRFSGISIYNSEYNGTYGIWLELFDNNSGYLDSDFYFTTFYTYDQFDPPPLTFQPPNSASGSDVDSDGLFEFMEINATVNITEAGYFTILSVMVDADWNIYGPVSNSGYFGVGVQVVHLLFPAGKMYENGVIGEFEVQLIATDESGNILDTDYFMTGNFTYSQFEAPPATLDYPFYSDAVDPDFDGIYEQFVESITVNVTVAGWYTVEGELVDSSLVTISTASAYSYLTVGSHTVNLTFDGVAIFNSQRSPYMVFLELYDGSGLPIDTHYSYVGGYDWTEFGTLAPQVQIDYVQIRDAPNGGGSQIEDITLDRGEGMALWCAGYNYSYGFVMDCSAFWTSSNMSIANVTTSGSSTMMWCSLTNIGNSIITASFNGMVDSATVKVRDLPHTTITLSGTKGNNGWYTSPVEVSLTATDALEGVNRTLCMVDTGSWGKYASPVDINGEGLHTVCYYSVDNGDNSERTRSVTVKIDMTPPTLSITQANGTDFNGTPAVLSWTGSDAASGIDHYEYSLDGGAFQYVNASAVSLTFANLTTGNHYLIVRAIDVAGLTTEKRVDFTVTPGTDDTGGTGIMTGLMSWLLIAVVVAFFIFLFLLYAGRDKKNGTIK